jgi:hypothetical protein
MIVGRVYQAALEPSPPPVWDFGLVEVEKDSTTKDTKGTKKGIFPANGACELILKPGEARRHSNCLRRSLRPP